jgi:hypothetical protein
MTSRTTSVFIAVLCLGATCPTTEDLDEGFHVTDEGLELQPGALPFWVEGDATVPLGVVEDAVEWWNAAVDCDADSLFVAEPGDVAQVTVSVGYVAVDPMGDVDSDVEGSPLGVAALDYDLVTGVIRGCEVTISSDIAYDEATVAQVARHEIGCHCAGALADDPGPPMTVDLESICSSPLDPLGDLTAADRARFAPFCP